LNQPTRASRLPFRKLFLAALAGTATNVGPPMFGGFTAGCGSGCEALCVDDSGTCITSYGQDASDAQTDAHRDGGRPADATKETGAGDSTVDSAHDAADAPCNFAQFVLGLIHSPGAEPSTFLGQTCTDDKNQADFASLFPP
jgi:hypothetical protein